MGKFDAVRDAHAKVAANGKAWLFHEALSDSMLDACDIDSSLEGCVKRVADMVGVVVRRPADICGMHQASFSKVIPFRGDLESYGFAQ